MEMSSGHRYSSLNECLQDLFSLIFTLRLETCKKKKSRDFYEAILIKTGSTIITHTSTTQKPNLIDFSKISTQRILLYDTIVK